MNLSYFRWLSEVRCVQRETVFKGVLAWNNFVSELRFISFQITRLGQNLQWWTQYLLSNCPTSTKPSLTFSMVYHFCDIMCDRLLCSDTPLLKCKAGYYYFVYKIQQIKIGNWWGKTERLYWSWAIAHICSWIMTTNQHTK